MIIKESDLRFSAYHDSRGQVGMSGQLSLGKHKNGTAFLVKSGNADIANEYAAHRLAKLIGVPTSDAVLITGRRGITGVGIVYEQDFKRINMDDFFGGVEHNEEVHTSSTRGKPCLSSESVELKYPDDSPMLADVMRYVAFRHMIVLEDIVQLAVSQGRVISFDYAESFYMSSFAFDFMLRTGKVDTAVVNFDRHLFLKDSYESDIEILRRPDTEFLRNAHDEPFRRFSEVDRESILSDLDEVFPPVVANFYYNCFECIQDKINELK